MYVPSSSKAEAVARAYRLAGLAPEPLGPGSKERRSVLEGLAAVVGVDPDAYPGKVRLAAAVAEASGVRWLPTYWSAGETIRTEGIDRLVEGVLRRQMSKDPGALARVQTMVDLVWTDATEYEPDDTHAGAISPHQEKVVTMPIELTEERGTLERSVAEAMATLSELQETPPEVRARGSFTAEDVRFTDTSWMTHLQQVEDWLRLAADVDQASPEAAAASLARGLGDAEAATLVDPHNRSRLSDAGLECLLERLERAQQLQDLFKETLDSDGGSEEAAGQAWLDGWEDAEVEKDLGSTGPIVAKSQTWPISTVRTHAKKGRLVLTPTYQRGDVWPNTDAQLLIESILRGIPLPSIILLRKEEDNDSVFEVVDGKQRLTAILRFIGAHPRAVRRVREVADEHKAPELPHLFETDYPAFQRRWKELMGERLTASLEREYYFPYALRLSSPALSPELRALHGKYYTEVRETKLRVADEAGDISDVFEGTPQYQLPVIEYSKATAEQIHEVFNLYNKQGKHLNAEEIRNAIYQSLDFMRALLVVAGDLEDIDAAAPFLRVDWEDLSSTPQVLRDYAFGTARFRRTKLLSWVASVLFFDPADDRGHDTLRSTAGQINALLDRVAGSSKDPLRDRRTILAVMQAIDSGLDLHAAFADTWAPTFVNPKKKGRWQELQLVASMCGVIGAWVVLGDETEERMVVAAPDLQRATASKEWSRPSKTQTRKQWEYIATVAVGIWGLLGVSPEDVDTQVRARFGYSGVGALVRALPAEGEEIRAATSE